MHSVDLHAHVLPGVDDGPDTLGEALELARAAVAAGTRHLVATPHVNEDRYIATEAIAPAVARLQEQLDAEGIPLRLHAGAEVALPRLADLDSAQLRAARLGHGETLLLESPFSRVPVDLEPLLFEVQTRGHQVLLAHPERSPTFQHDPEQLARLVEAGVLVQITAGSLRGAFGTRVRDFTHQLLRDELVHVVASDAHNTDRRPPGVADAVHLADRTVPGIGRRAEWLCDEVPWAILTGGRIPAPPSLPASRGGAWRRRVRAASSTR